MFSQAGQFEIQATGYNEDGTASASSPLTVNNVPASGSADINGSTEQGSAYSITAFFDDPAGTPATGWSVAWGDGTVDTYPVPANHAAGAAGDVGTDDAASGTFSHAYTQPGTFYPTITTSFIRGSYTSNGAVTVQQANPSIWLNSPTQIAQTDSYSLNANYYDSANPGGQVVTAWLYDWGDGTTSVDANPALSDTASHQYSQAGTYTVTAVAETGWGPYQGGFSTTTSVQVTGAPFGGTAYAFGPGSVEQSSPYALFTDFAATGGDSLSGWSILWGDGAGDWGNAPSFAHAFSRPGTYNIVATATDACGACYVASTQVDVTPLNPTVLACGAGETGEGSDYTLNLGFIDAGVSQPDSWLVKWGDGATSVVDGSSFTTADHTYTSAGDFSIEADAMVNGTAYSAVTPGVVVMAPSAPTNLTATPVSASEIDLAWTNTDPTLNVIVQRSLAGQNSWTTLAMLAPGAAGAYNDTDPNLTAGTAYDYQIYAQDSQGYISPPIAVTASTPALPVAPTGLTATPASTTEIDLAWTPGDSTSQIQVQRSDDGGGTFTALATLAAGATSFNDTGLTEGKAYIYQLVALGALGSTATSDSTAVNTLPLAPSNLTGTQDSSGNVNLTWTDNSANADGYQIFTSGDGVNFTLYDTVSASATTYADTAPSYGNLNFYEVKATAGNSESAPSNIFSITPTAPPVAKDDSYSVLHDQTLIVAANGVLANDTGSPGDTLTVSSASGTAMSTAHGSVTLNADGSFDYTPNDAWVGTDTFTYTAADGTFLSQPATVTITVTNQMPRAGDIFDNTYNYNPTNTSVAADPVIAHPGDWDCLSATDPDGLDSLTYKAVNPDGSVPTASAGGGVATAHGNVQVSSDGTYTYTPAAGFVGTDRFYYVASDGIMNSNVATVTIKVDAGIPIAGMTDFAVDADSSFMLIPAGGATGIGYSNLLGSGHEQNVDLAQFQVLSQPHIGHLVAGPLDDVNAPRDGSLWYVTPKDVSGIDTFTYGFGPDVPPTTALINVNTAWGMSWGNIGSMTYTVSHGDVLTQRAPGGLLTRAYHPQGGTLSVNILTAPSSGTLVLGADPTTGQTDGSFTYTPSTGTTGWVYFTYDVTSTDGTASPPLTGAIDVTDYLPLIPQTNPLVWTYQGQAQRMDMRQPYVDAEHPLNSLTTALVPGMGPKHGTLEDNHDGTYTYIPGNNPDGTPYVGPDYFTYQIADGVSTSTHGNVTQSDDTQSNYQTVFIDVRPLPVSLSIADLQPGDPSATVVLDPTANNTSVLHLNLPVLPLGTKVTLSLKDQQPVPSDSSDQPKDLVEVFDPNGLGLPAGPVGQLVLGSGASGDAGEERTWIVGVDAVPGQLLVSGNATGTLKLELDVTPGDNNGGAEEGTQIFGGICLATPGGGGVNPASQPALAGQRATTQRAGALPFKVLPTFTIGLTANKGAQQGNVYTDLPKQIVDAFDKAAQVNFAPDHVEFYDGGTVRNEQISSSGAGADANAVAGWIIGFDFSKAKIVGGNFGTPDLSACVVDYMPYTILFSDQNNSATMETDYTVTTRTGNNPPITINQYIVNPSVAKHELWHTDGNVGVPIQWAPTFGNGVDPNNIKRYGGFAQGAFDQWWNVAEPHFEVIAKQTHEPAALIETDLVTIISKDLLSAAGRDAVTQAGEFHDANQIYLTGLPPAR